jgi:S-DNA-T family DNA segregation ATPase FtsK/SpoIIIE
LPIGPRRKAPEITDPSARPSPRRSPRKPAGRPVRRSTSCLRSTCFRSAANSAPKIDKLSLERNARLLETVLDDFNVKGEITAVRTGPVVTMYELEPAPGIKASRVVGLADDIARNMSAISARVSSIPGRTVMGIELPNADRQMVSFKEMVACEAFANHKGMLPIILGKDIAGEPVVADLADHAAPAGGRHHRLGQVGRPQLHPAVAAVPLHPAAVPPDPGRSQGAGTQELRRHSRTCSRPWSPSRPRRCAR